MLSPRLFRTHVPAGGAPPEPAPLTGLWQRAQALAASLPPFAVRAERLRSVARGVHRRRRAGPGDSFWQFRAFQPGEPVALVDWRRSARSDSLYVRQHEWETAQNVWLWFDGSASMHFRSSGAADSKSDRAVLLGLAAARLMVSAGERVALYGVHERAAGGPYGLERLLAALETERLRDCDPFPPPHAIPRHARLLLIGDFLGEEGDVQARLRRLVGLGVKGHLLQILDPVEEDFPYSGRVRFEGVEANEDVLLDRADDLADLYRRRLQGWIEALGAMCRRVDWTHSLHRTDHSAAAALLGLMALAGRSA